jgi:hypothetical protein
MKRLLFVLSLFVVLVSLATPSFAQPTVSAKQDIAIFALGYYGWNIPDQVLGSIDMQIQKVFSDLGRFTVFGASQRLSSASLEQFIATMKKSKEQNFVMPEKFQFGEAFLTQAEFNKLVGAFIVVAPVVTSFNTAYNYKSSAWETSITTSFTFINVAEGGSVISIETVETSGSDKTNSYKSMQSAIDGIPGELQFKIRSMPSFQINTKILAKEGSTVRIQLGKNMGIVKGDEYAIVENRKLEGFDDSKEIGLIVIKDVGPEVSTGQVLYNSGKLDSSTQLKEIARRGVDFDLSIHSTSDSLSSTLLFGFHAALSRGYYGVRPYIGLFMPTGQTFSWLTGFFVPLNVVVGAEYVMNMGRLSFAPYAGVGASYLYVSDGIIGKSTSTSYLTHAGAQVYARIAYLFNRNTRVFVDLGYEKWFHIDALSLFSTYGGVSIGAGLTFKL